MTWTALTGRKVRGGEPTMRKGSYSEELVRMCRDEHEGDLQRVESRIFPDTNVYTGVEMMTVCAAVKVEAK